MNAPRLKVEVFEFLFVEAAATGDQIIDWTPEVERVKREYVDWASKVSARRKKENTAELMEEAERIARQCPSARRKILVKRRVS